MLGLIILGGTAASGLPVGARQDQLNELDAFMARVLERREESWRRLHDYVLDEREQFSVVGPGRTRLHGLQREFTWYVRDGFFVRSPVRANGVTVSESDRRQYEDRWFEREKARAGQRNAKQAEAAGATAGSEVAPDWGDEDLPVDPDVLVRQGGEPRFISEAYFLKFKFEPGNYYLVGREPLDGREVLRVEYYPRRLFSDGDRNREHSVSESGPDTGRRDQDGRKKRPRDPGDVDETDLERKFDKVAVVTLWVDPAESQIVKYTFDNVGLGFLPGRWIVRFDDLRASMTMGRYFDAVWLPREIRFEGGLTLASGAYGLEYTRTFSDYRQAETKAIIRGYAPKHP
jgi:hypothetical protein